MENQNGNYQQQKITGLEQQTVITDSSETSETDELNPSFNVAGDSDPDPEDQKVDNPEDQEENNDNLDGEGLDEKNLGAGTTVVEKGIDDAGLNHDQQDDLSLNADEDSII